LIVTAYTTGACELPFTIDTNILVYTIDHAAGAKQASAISILRQAAGQDCRLTLQALAEFNSVATGKQMLTPDRAHGLITTWLTLFPQPIPLSPAALLAASSRTTTSGFSFWDALLVATAAQAGCLAVISDDMAPGATLAGARIVRGFDAAGAVSAEARAVIG
jgi:predicted nucleic acid-binding protein